MASATYLLDTNCLIWFQENNARIPASVMKLIQDTDNTILFSQISIFEISIKQKIGKLLTFNTTVQEIFEQAVKDGFTFLNIHNQHIYNYSKIPLIETHRDPFDRLLIATAMAETAVILSADKKFNKYKDLIKLYWE